MQGEEDENPDPVPMPARLRRRSAELQPTTLIPPRHGSNTFFHLQDDNSDEDLDPVPMSMRLRRRSAELQVVAPARGYVSAPSSPRAHVAAIARAQAEWGGGSDRSDDGDLQGGWAGFVRPLELPPLRHCRLRPFSAPQVLNLHLESRSRVLLPINESLQSAECILPAECGESRRPKEPSGSAQIDTMTSAQWSTI